MAYTKAGQRAVDKYVKNNYDNLTIRVSKGRKADIQTHAEQRGESLNGFVNRAIDNQVAQDNAVKAFTIQTEEGGDDAKA